MTFVTLNGVKSTTLDGLLIQSLPKITKPRMRTQIEEIDGRDGDVVTKLGYAAYDREMSVGLYGRFRLDEVIAFFTGEGTAIFSNEPDKVYRYQILEQIDYERLLRFRTAVVKFHVQPFKYSSVEGVLSKDASGIASFSVANTGNVVSKPTVTVYGSGTVSLIVNGETTLTMAVGDDDFITVDAERLEAYRGDTLKNRYVTGDYEKLKFSPGRNTVSWTGAVSRVDLQYYSRWI